MTTDDVRSWIATTVGELTGVAPDAVHDAAFLVDDLGLDSLGLAEIYARAEARFRIRVDPAEARRCERVGEMIWLIVANLQRVAS